MKYLFLILCLTLCYCTESEPDGLCSSPPKLSKEKLLFNAQGGIDSVVAAENHWWLNAIYEKGCENIGAGNESDYCNNNYCSHNGSESQNLTMTIECPWFTVKKIGEHTIFVSVDKNETGEERSDIIRIQAGNCHSGFYITQSGE